MVSKYFTRDELKCSHCGEMGLSDAFLGDLDRLRETYGSPIYVNSGFRCAQHPLEKGKAFGPGAHCYGAIDARCYGAAAVTLIDVALGLGWTGFGIKQLGPIASRYVHLDRMPARPHAPRPTIWNY